MGIPQVQFWERNVQRTEESIQSYIVGNDLDYEFISREMMKQRIDELEVLLKEAINFTRMPDSLRLIISKALSDNE